MQLLPSHSYYILYILEKYNFFLVQSTVMFFSCVNNTEEQNVLIKQCFLTDEIT